MVTYPAEWNEKTFIEFMKIKRGASPRPIESYLTSSTDGVNWIKIQKGHYIQFVSIPVILFFQIR